MKLSVIIPALNEAKTIYHTLEDLFTQHKPDEVLVVDGGSEDKTVAIAGEWARVIRSKKGRARQLNQGAREASGEILLFLHADTRLPKFGLSYIKNAIRRGTQAGRFRMQFDDRRLILRLFEAYTRFHVFSYGDQGFFVTRELFDRLKGFREDVPFEDLDFYKRLRAVTHPLILKHPVVTSARRFTKTGCLKQKWINLFLMGLYYAGFKVLPAKEKLYPEIR